MFMAISLIIGVCNIAIVTIWMYDMEQSGVTMSPSSVQSEVWFLSFVYELIVKGILSNLWGTLVYGLVFFSGFLSLVSIVI